MKTTHTHAGCVGDADRPRRPMSTTTARVTALADQVEKLCLDIQNRRNHEADWSAQECELAAAMTRLEKLAPAGLLAHVREAAEFWFAYGQCGPDCAGCVPRIYRKFHGKQTAKQKLSAEQWRWFVYVCWH